MGPDATLDVNDLIGAMNDIAKAIDEFAAHVEKLGDSCGPTREDHDVVYCVNCEGGFCRRCGRADAWHTRCAHEPAWRHDI